MDASTSRVSPSPAPRERLEALLARDRVVIIAGLAALTVTN